MASLTRSTALLGSRGSRRSRGRVTPPAADPSQANGRVKRRDNSASPRPRTRSSNPVPSSGESANFWFLKLRNRYPEPEHVLGYMERTLSTGTEGSNPACSSGESAANSIFEIPGLLIAICPPNRRHCIRLNSFLPRPVRNGAQCCVV
jgi:hypothetical protein